MNSNLNLKNNISIKGGFLSLCLLMALTLFNSSSYGSITLTTNITNTCSGTNNGTITLTVSNGIAPYSFAWNNGASTQNLIGLASGTYSVTVTDASAHVSSISATVNIANNPSTPGAISGSSNVCQGGVQTYSVTNVPGATSYGWSLPTGWIGTSTTNSIIVTVGAGRGNVSVYSANNCGISNYTRVLDVNVNVPPVEPTSIHGNSGACAGTSQTYFVDEVQGATSYIWTLPPGWIGYSSNSMITVTIGGSSGIISVKSTNSCGTSPNRNLAVSVNSIPPISISSATDNYNYCSQIAPTSVSLIATPSYCTYIWSPSGGNSKTATVNSVNTYTVTGRNVAGCTTTATRSVTNNCATPTNLNTFNIFGTSAKATWNQSQCGYNYSIRISKHNQNNWSTYTILASDDYTFSGLSLNTQYDWQIQTNCNTSGSINSGWSSIKTFTTAAERLEELAGTSSSFNIYPNPSNNQVSVSFSTMEEGSYSINLTDMTGRTIKTELDNAALGENKHVMNIEGVSKGLYMVTIQKGQTILNSKLVID